MLLGLFLLGWIFEDPGILFFIAEAVHCIGVYILVIKVAQRRSVAGLSLGMQLMTALFLTVRIYCSLRMEFNFTQLIRCVHPSKGSILSSKPVISIPPDAPDRTGPQRPLFFPFPILVPIPSHCSAVNLHVVLDALVLGATCWVIYEMTGPLAASYRSFADLDNMQTVFLIVPSAALAMIARPEAGGFGLLDRSLWAFSIYLEALSNLPQLVLFQNAKVVDKFTGHYVFCLALSRQGGMWVIPNA